ncbi:hypothetical protein Tco_0437735, partial [Tanacetum coccineum]
QTQQGIEFYVEEVSNYLVLARKRRKNHSKKNEKASKKSQQVARMTSKTLQQAPAREKKRQ